MRKQMWICLVLIVGLLCVSCGTPQQVQPSQETPTEETAQAPEQAEATRETQPLETEETQPLETEQTQPPTQAQPSFSQLQTGYYILTTLRSDDGMTMEGEAAKQMMWYITVNENRSGQVYQAGRLSRLEWSDRYVIWDGYDVKYCIDGDQIIVDRAGVDQLTFTYHGQTLPEYLQHPELKAGTYLLYMFTEYDEFYMVEYPAPENGYLELREDKTGTLHFFVEDVELQWENMNLHYRSSYMPYRYFEIKQDGVSAGLLIVEYSNIYTLAFCTEGITPNDEFSNIISSL